MNKNKNILERKILSYDDVAAYPAGNSDEQLIDVRTFDQNIVAEYAKFDMIPYSGEIIYIRQTLAKMLAAVNSQLSLKGYKLKVFYGYRHPEVQEKYFITRRNILITQNPSLDDEGLDRLTHNFVAVPSVAGHPAGAAVDLTLVDSEGNELNMGTAIADYSDPGKVITFAEGITSAQAANRQILHDAMIDQGFAPFYGEWWHFSYGDREWAAFYNKTALYGPVDFKV